MGQDPDKVAAMYDSVAKEYASEFRDEHAKKPKDREILSRFAQEMKGREPLWDLGCGPGQTAAFLTDLGLEVCGLDLSAKILEQAKSIHPGIRFEQGSLLDLEFADDSVAGTVAFYSMVHFSRDQVKTALAEIFRVLQPDGLFLLTFHIGDETIHLRAFLGKEIDIDFMSFPTGFIVSCLESTGFEQIEVIEREPYPQVEYQSRRAYVFAYKPGGP
jgi:ubiquinone/menaquinone biosynthesis C-methylase UbiE